MAKKKNNNFWYILGGVVIVVLFIVIVVLQIQNKQRQEELEKQQDNLQFVIDTQNCVGACTAKWNNEQGSCEKFYTNQRNNGWEPSSTDSNVLDCSGALPTKEMGATCQCKCVCAGLTSNFLI